MLAAHLSLRCDTNGSVLDNAVLGYVATRSGPGGRVLFGRTRVMIDIRLLGFLCLREDRFLVCPVSSRFCPVWLFNCPVIGECPLLFLLLSPIPFCSTLLT